MTRKIGTSPKSMNWSEWDETVVSGPNTSEFYSAAEPSNTEASTSAYASPGSVTSSSEIDWGTWALLAELFIGRKSHRHVLISPRSLQLQHARNNLKELLRKMHLIKSQPMK
ncbi:predicted protein [Botrytis cinerea T4]|uniref:Uncharacterized protein n=1 Tax=Botryotinia fuckeliana (strain T4) TaxID=999810 RepID=G2XP51_BOTF4|nr:predicted protein [Botrytis cinerea T4]